MLISILVVILLLSSVVLFSERIPPRYHTYLMWGTILILTIICMTRPAAYATDYLNYEKYFYAFDKKIMQLTVEPTFLFISKVIYKAGGTIGIVMCIYAFISIPLKLYSLKKVTNNTIFLLSTIVYLSNYYMLHDCEQIRLAAALSFGMFAFYLKTKNNYLWIVALLVGTSFHHTLAALFIPFILCPKEFNKIWYIVLCLSIPISVLLWILNINIITTLPIPYIETKLLLYQKSILEGSSTDVRVLNIMVIIRILIFYYLLYYYNNIKEHLSKCVELLMICDAFSIVSWFALAEMSVIAVRISQLYGFFEIILFATIYYTIKPHWVGKILVIVLSLYNFIQFYIYNYMRFI